MGKLGEVSDNAVELKTESTYQVMGILTLEKCINKYGGCSICNADTSLSYVFATPLTSRDLLFNY